MGNMSEEMKKIMAKWGTDAQVQEPPAVQGETAANAKPKTTNRDIIYNTIKDNPGITSVGVMMNLKARNIPQAYNSITSQITGMFHEFFLRRESVQTPGMSRPLYAYYAVPPVEALKLKAEHERKKEMAQARAERARKAKAEKTKQKLLDAATAPATSTSTLMPQEQLALPFNAPQEAAAPAAPDLRVMSAMDILNGVTLLQAKELYKQLKEVFGG